MDNFYSTSPLDHDDDLLDEIPLRFEGLDDFFRAAERDSGDIGLLLGTYLPSSSLISTPDTGVSFTDLLLSPTLTADGGSPSTLTPMPSTPPNGGNMIESTSYESTSYDEGKIYDFQLNHEPPAYTPYIIPEIVLTPGTRTLPFASPSFSRDDNPQLYAPLPPQTLSDLTLSPLSLLSPSISTCSSLSPWSSPLSLPPSPLMGASHEVGFFNPSSPFMKIPSRVQRHRQRSLDDGYIPAISLSKRSRIVPAHEDDSAKADHPTSKSDGNNNNEHHASVRPQQIQQQRQQRRSQPRHLNDQAPSGSGSGSGSSSSKSIGHLSDGPSRCKKCNKSFGRGSDHLRHLIQTKCSDDPLKCVCKYPHCGRAFCRYDAALRHSRLEHGGEEGPFEFVRKSELLSRTEESEGKGSDEETARPKKKQRTQASRK